MGCALLESRKTRVDVFQRPARLRCGHLRELEVLGDGQVREDSPLFGDEGDSGARVLHHLLTRDVAALECDRSRARRYPTDDALERRGLADAVAAEQCDRLALVDA